MAPQGGLGADGPTDAVVMRDGAAPDTYRAVEEGPLAAHLTGVLLARRSGDRIAGWAFTAAGTLGLCFVAPMAVQAAAQNGRSTGTGGAADLAAFPGDLFGPWTMAVPVSALAALGLCFAGRRALPLAVWIALPLPVAWRRACSAPPICCSRCPRGCCSRRSR